MKIPIDEKCDDKLKEKEIVITLVTFYYFVNKLFVLLLVRNVLKNTSCFVCPLLELPSSM